MLHHGDRQRDPRSAGDGPTARVRRPQDPLARRSDRPRHGAQPALLRRQESRLLDPAVDRLERLFLPADAVRHRQQPRLDAARPHAAADRDRLFADPADGLAVPPAHPDEAGVDAGRCRWPRSSSPRASSRSSRRGASRPSSSPSSSPKGSPISARCSSTSRCSRRGPRSITGSTTSSCWRTRSACASGWRARRRRRSSRCCAISSTRTSCSTR